MQPLNLPPFEANIKKMDGMVKIQDVLRRKFVALTPEEWVRQHFVHFLIEQKGGEELRIKGSLYYLDGHGGEPVKLQGGIVTGREVRDVIYALQAGSIFCDYPMISFNMKRVAVPDKEGTREIDSYEELKEWWQK